MQGTTNGVGAHHLRITEFPEALMEATDALFASFAWRGDAGEQQRKAQKWVDAAAAVYEFDGPEVLIQPAVDGFGMYNRASNVIVLPKMSVISLFHFFRYAWQEPALDLEILTPAFGGVRQVEDAAAFSTSLFHLARPELFRTAVTAPQHTVCYVRPSDLVAA